jgi:hypothetical protein
LNEAVTVTQWSFGWVPVPAQNAKPTARKVLVAFLRGALTDGQSLAAPLQFALRPKELAAREIKALWAIQ